MVDQGWSHPRSRVPDPLRILDPSRSWTPPDLDHPGILTPSRSPDQSGDPLGIMMPGTLTTHSSPLHCTVCPLYRGRDTAHASTEQHVGVIELQDSPNPSNWRWSGVRTPPRSRPPSIHGGPDHGYPDPMDLLLGSMLCPSGGVSSKHYSSREAQKGVLSCPLPP